MYLSSTLRLVTCASIVLPVTVKSPATVNPANVGESVVCNPKSIVDAATPLVVNLASPWPVLSSTEADTIVLPFIVVILARLVAMSVANELLKLAVAVFSSASVANVVPNEELNASWAVTLVLNDPLATTCSAMSDAIDALVAVKAPDTAVLSALPLSKVAISVAIEELKLAVAVLSSASVANEASREELKSSNAFISVAILADVDVNDPEIAPATPEIVFNWADPENNSPPANLKLLPLIVVPLISPGAINVPDAP